ncbi:MAG: hypothetical protein CM15mP29_0860 [Alphaproteobacteria bacterium]|nr:MAG: hypothetical protein CM15mP29_0860 [Alphaproteobacteria bacterium]
MERVINLTQVFKRFHQKSNASIIDPDGPGGKPISVLSRGAILQTRSKIRKIFIQKMKEWGLKLMNGFREMWGLGPMAGRSF